MCYWEGFLDTCAGYQKGTYRVHEEREKQGKSFKMVFDHLFIDDKKFFLIKTEALKN